VESLGQRYADGWRSLTGRAARGAAPLPPLGFSVETKPETPEAAKAEPEAVQVVLD
jgi:hypothetical protein